MKFLILLLVSTQPSAEAITAGNKVADKLALVVDQLKDVEKKHTKIVQEHAKVAALMSAKEKKAYADASRLFASNLIDGISALNEAKHQAMLAGRHLQIARVTGSPQSYAAALRSSKAALQLLDESSTLIEISGTFLVPMTSIVGRKR